MDVSDELAEYREAYFSVVMEENELKRKEPKELPAGYVWRSRSERKNDRP